MKKIYFILSLMLIGTVQLFAQTNTWDGSSSSNWNTAANWSLNLVPTSAHDVVIPDNEDVTVNTAAVCKTFTINSGGNDNTITINAGQSLTVSGAVTINAGTGDNDDKIIAVGSSTLTCVSVTMATTGGDTRDCEITISTGTVTISGDLTMNGTAARNAIRFSGAGTLNVGGDVASGGDIIPFSTTSGLVNYNGTSGDQTVKSDTYADITFSGGATKTLATGGIIVTDVATFTDGVVTSTSGNLFTINAGGSATGAADASFVNGPIAKTGTTAFTFPVGNTTGNTPNKYHPISIGIPSASETFTAQYFRASASTVDADKVPGLYGISNCEYWSLTRAGTATTDVTTSWNANSPCGGPYINTLLGLVMAWYDAGVDSRWEVSGGTGITNTSVAPFTSGTSKRTALSTYGFLTFGNADINGSPLPVKLSNIKAYEKQQGIQLDWTAYSEENLGRYAIERSADGITFTSIGYVNALNTVTETNYGFFDPNPLQGISYYRLKNIDLDGKFGYSTIVRVNLDKNSKDITVYPNPATGGFVSLQTANLAKGNYAVKIFNAGGQQVYIQRFIHSGGSINQTIQLPHGTRSGMYSIQLDNGAAKVMNKTFMVQ